MGGTGPWSVKGIDDTTRAIAREAAERAGLPIGVWIDRAILKAAADATVGLGTILEGAAQAGTTLLDMRREPPGPAAAVVVQASPPEPSAHGVPVASAAEPSALQRPAASPLDVPPLADERTAVETPALAPYDRNEGMRYGLGGAAALLLVVLGITGLDRLAFSPGPTDAASVASTQPASLPDRASLAPVAKAAVDTAGGGASREMRPATTPAVLETRAERLTARAAAGDAEAQLELGLSYIAGVDVPKDEGRAVEWLEKAAAQGLAPAQFNLAILYERGRGVARDLQHAVRLYQDAAHQGYASAQHNLATLYATGSGVAQNYDEAAKWFTRAAEGGNPQSLYSLGLMYEHGLGVERDMAQAREHYQRAADGGSADARSKLAALGDPPEPKPQPSDTAEAVRTAAAAEPAAGPPETVAPGSDQLLDRRQTVELQRLLSRLDFAAGAPDGVVGRRTVAAIKLYQEFAGLPVDGKSTRGLLEDVRQVAGALGRQVSPSP